MDHITSAYVGSSYVGQLYGHWQCFYGQGNASSYKQHVEVYKKRCMFLLANIVRWSAIFKPET